MESIVDVKTLKYAARTLRKQLREVQGYTKREEARTAHGLPDSADTATLLISALARVYPRELGLADCP